jgi:hypothetical protein
MDSLRQVAQDACNPSRLIGIALVEVSGCDMVDRHHQVVRQEPWIPIQNGISRGGVRRQDQLTGERGEFRIGLGRLAE